MAVTFGMRIKSAWNAFMNRDPTTEYVWDDLGNPSSFRPDRPFLRRGNERSIVAVIFNRIAVDCSMINLVHARIDENNNYQTTIDSNLNNCLTLSANIDQTNEDFIQDVVLSMFDEGHVAIVATDSANDPLKHENIDVLKLRTGRIVQWYPQHVKVNIYNELNGIREDVTLPKERVAIIENPFYAVMNEPNSVLQRLLRNLNYLDTLNSQTSSGRLDLIIQLPFVVKSELRQKQAEARRKQIENQLVDSKYGIAYTDGTERITQLNRAVENTLWDQVKDQTAMLYNHLGMTEAVLNGTASEQEMLNYYNQTINPVLSRITKAMTRTFLTKTARSQGQSIYYFRDPFNLVPVEKLAEIADKFTRNEIASSNEIRAIVGWRPSDQPGADELRNKNLNRNNTDYVDGMYDPYYQEETMPIEET